MANSIFYQYFKLFKSSHYFWLASFDEDKKKVCFRVVDKPHPTFVRLKVYIERPTSDARLSGTPDFRARRQSRDDIILIV